jgi:hypothetical protein
MSETTDYNLDYLTVDTLLPAVAQTDINRALINSGINRFLTKPEYQSISGGIGILSKNTITEDTSTEEGVHRQAYQLQPLIFSDKGSQTHISSFFDILQKCKILGINPDTFDKWGTVDQYSWVPPIDIDKFANYQDYYWVGDGEPDYITIQNKYYLYKSQIIHYNDALAKTKCQDLLTQYTQELAKTNTIRDHKSQWTISNSWVHKYDLSDSNGTALYPRNYAAQMPIIEYNDDIQMNEWLYIRHDWEYRKDTNSNWISTDQEPNDIEIYARYPIIEEGDRYFKVQSNNNIKTGDVFTIKASNNNGHYVATSVVKESPTTYKVYVANTLIAGRTISGSDYADDESLGTTQSIYGVMIPLKTTSLGDPWLGFLVHWRLKSVGIPKYVDKQVPDPNQYTVILNAMPSTGFDGYILNETYNNIGFESNGGFHVYFDGSTRYEFNKDYVYDSDDLQIYLNGIRRYDIFNETIEATPTATHVIPNSIDINLELKPNDIITIKVGPAALSDKNRYHVLVRNYDDTITYKNLCRYRLHEQYKKDPNQHIRFDLFDMYGNTIYQANNLLGFKPDHTFDIHPILKSKVAYDTNNYIIENKLFDNGLVFYKRNDTLHSVWKKNKNPYIPQQVGKDRSTTGLKYWAIPEPFSSNIKHTQDDAVLYSELKYHFQDIIENSHLPYSHIRFNESPKYNGGYIKEYAGGYDLFISMMQQNTVNFIDVLEFAKTSYAQQLHDVRMNIVETMSVYMLNNKLPFSDIIEYTTNNVLRDNMRKLFNNVVNSPFHDSTTNNKYITNWVATAPNLGLSKLFTPMLLGDHLRHHDGHLSSINLSTFEYGLLVNKLNAATKIFGQGNYYNDNGTLYRCFYFDATPTNPKVGDLRNTASEAAPVIVKYNGSTWISATPDDCWSIVDPTTILATILIDIENTLYDSCTTPNRLTSTIQDITTNRTADLYAELNSNFLNYIQKTNNSLEFIDYDITDPFTWNYLGIQAIPNASRLSGFKFPARYWEIYERLYGTRFPHLEPWVLQGYTSEPTNWRSVYFNGTWNTAMWDNIKRGIIHPNLTRPNIPNIPTYSIISVNTTDTKYGKYAPGDLLPPYVAVSGLTHESLLNITIDPTVISYISRTYLFGQQGPVEKQWMESIDYVYDVLKALFMTSPIHILYKSFGYDTINIDGLDIDVKTGNIPSHTNTLFHGTLA